jgi:hypothetical protein
MERKQDLKYTYGDHQKLSAREYSRTKVVPRKIISSLEFFKGDFYL